MKQVCILPAFPAGAMGGVAIHVQAITRHLKRRGWRVTSDPLAAPNALVHTHALDRAPEVGVYTNHGIYPIKANMPEWQAAANRAIFDNIKLARQVIAVSQWTADQWSGLTGVKPHIIPNGVDLEQWRAVPRGKWRAILGLEATTPLVVWGKTSLSDVLDPTPMLELALRCPQMRFVTPLAPKLLPVAPTNVHCIGPQRFEAMQMLLADCDVYLATVCENHSIQVLEALALGKPIVGYNWGGTAETLTYDNAQCGGILVAPGELGQLHEALARALEERVTLGAMGQALAAERYQWSQQVARLEQVYELAQADARAEAQRETPLISVIIPCYNKADYVSEAIRSVLAQQQAPPFELIIVDDGSADDSLRVIREATKKRDLQRRAPKSLLRVEVIAQANAGVAAARNAGITQARGRYITCLDADDLIEPSFLHRTSAALDADPGLGIAYSDMLVFGDWPDRGPWQNVITCSDYDFDKLRRGNFIPCCNMFRKSAWQRAGGYKNINPSWEDYELWLNMGKLGWYGRHVPGALFHYRKLYREGRDFESQDGAWRLRGLVNTYHRDLYAPAVSIVIPCYQQSRFLADAIRSALAQTFPDLEVVVVDDGNEPQEAAAIARIVDEYATQSRGAVRLVRHETNMLLAEARNTGIREARGQWIVPLDADDWLAPEFVEECLAAIRMDPRRFAYTDSYLSWQINGEARLQELPANEYDFDELLRKVTWACTILYAKDSWQAAGGYKPQMSDAGGWEDWEFAVTLGEIGVCGVRVPKPLFYYRQHATNQMRYSAQARKPQLQEAMRRLHAATYRGDRPMACCGGGRTRQPAQQAQQAQPAQPAQPAAAPPARSAVPSNGAERLVRYVGMSVGRRHWRGPSGRSYAFGQTDPLQRMSAADADWFGRLPDFQLVEG